MPFTGVFAPVPTPFDRSDRVDTRRLKRALARWMTTPLSGIVILGSTGEAPLVDDGESDRIIAAARESVPPDRTLIAGTGRESTQAAIRSAKRAGQLGVDAVLVRTPGFYKAQLTTDSLVQHYTAVADASSVPVLLYQFPALTGVTLEPRAVATLAEHPNVVGMKDSSGDILQLTDYIACGHGAFQVLSGSSTTFHQAVSLGASGGILALSCVLPELCVRFFEWSRDGRHTEARDLQQRLLPIARLVGSQYGVPGLKAAVALAGYDVGLPRRPLPPASEDSVRAIHEALAAIQEQPA